MLSPKMKFRSPLRYPGGKTRAVKLLLDLIPSDVSICSPFVGGGSVELALALRGQDVKCYDAYKPLIDFWVRAVSDNGSLVRDIISATNGLTVTRGDFNEMKTRCKLSVFNSAVDFFVVNRCSFSGSTCSGGMSKGHPRFNISALDNLEKFSPSNIEFIFRDFKLSIPENKDRFLFLDPPYDISCFLYGNRGDKHEDFDHHTLRELLSQRDNWLMTYNDNEYIRSLYSDCDISEISWSYSMNASKKSNEVVITPKRKE